MSNRSQQSDAIINYYEQLAHWESLMKENPADALYLELIDQLEKYNKELSFLEDILSNINFKNANRFAKSAIHASRGSIVFLNLDGIENYCKPSFRFLEIFIKHLKEKELRIDEKDFSKEYPNLNNTASTIFKNIAIKKFNNTKYSEITKYHDKIRFLRNKDHPLDLEDDTIIETPFEFKDYHIKNIKEYLNKSFKIIDDIFNGKCKISDSGEGYFEPDWNATYEAKIKKIYRDSTDDKKYFFYGDIILQVWDKHNNTKKYKLNIDELTLEEKVNAYLSQKYKRGEYLKTKLYDSNGYTQLKEI